MSDLRIRGGSGLGDSIYLRPICEWYMERGNKVTVCTDYPDVFIGLTCKTEPFNRERIDVLAHYTSRKLRQDTNQWQDVCINAKIPLGDVKLSIDWKIRNRTLVNQLLELAAGKPIVLLSGGRAPMGRTDGFGKSLLPGREGFDAVLPVLRDCFVVQVGQGEQLYALTGVDWDMKGRTSVSDLFDIASVSRGLLGQCSWVIPMAEALDRPLLVVWAATGLLDRNSYLSSITPQKVLSKKSSMHVIDDWPKEDIRKIAGEFYESIRSS